MVNTENLLFSNSRMLCLRVHCQLQDAVCSLHFSAADFSSKQLQVKLPGRWSFFQDFKFLLHLLCSWNTSLEFAVFGLFQLQHVGSGPVAAMKSGTPSQGFLAENCSRCPDFQEMVHVNNAMVIQLMGNFWYLVPHERPTLSLVKLSVSYSLYAPLKLYF